MNTTRLALTVLSASLAAANAAQFKFPAHTLTVPDGYEIELIASSPLVDRPISVSFDDAGRLYATDSAGTGGKAGDHILTKPHRVVRLVDTDGDGKFDKQTVFADHMMFPEGALFYEGSLYVAAPPEIWKLTDADGDGVAEKREAWHDGKTLGGCGNDLHGPYLGRDGWIYWCKGAWAEQNYKLPSGREAATRSSQIFRRHPTRPGQEPVLTGGMDNPVGVAFTSSGERFLSCTFFQYPAQGKRDGLIHAIYGGVYGRAHDSLEAVTRTGDVMPVLTHQGAAAPCGLTAASAQLFGGGFGDHLLACYFNLHKVVRHELVPDGATFKTKDTDLVSCDDPDFHPTDVLEDADGSLIIVDTGGWYKMCCPTSQLAKPDVLGAIYRLRKIGAPKLDDPRGLKIAWSKSTPAELAKLLGDSRHYVRQRAIRELGKQGAAAVRPLDEVVTKAKSAEARVNAVWALTRIEGKAAREAIRTALNDSDARVIHAALNAIALWRDAGALGRLQTFLDGNDAALARAAAEALGRIGDKRAVPALLAAAAKHGAGRSELTPGMVDGVATSGDPARVLEHSLIYALIEIGDAPGTAASLASPNASARRAALIALDQMDGGGLKPKDVLPLRYSTERLLKQTALWIISHRSEWGDRLAAEYYGDLMFNRLPRPDPVETAAQLAQLAKSPAIQEILASLAGDQKVPAASRLIALRAMELAGLKESPPHWLDAIEAAFRNDDGDLARQAVATARTLTLPKKGAEKFLAVLQDGGRDPVLPADVRLNALAISGAPATVEPELFDFLVANVAPSKPLIVRGTAANVLAKAKLTPAQQLALADTAKSVSPLELPRLLPAFERGANEALGLKLVANLRDSAGVRGLRVDLVKPLIAKYPKSVQATAEPLLNSLNADASKQAAHLDELVKQLPPGDLRRGQVVFVSAKAACTTCHAQGHLGGRLGPDLTNLGKVRTERDLLEAIVYPSASFVRSYEPFTVVTKGGDDFTGIIKKDAPDEVILAIGPQQEQRVARADITEMRPGTVSIMPAGLEDVLTRQELSDLVTFLKSPAK